jgi:uncharacterized SAM-binding protein YcdF (DUF218 family)
VLLVAHGRTRAQAPAGDILAACRRGSRGRRTHRTSPRVAEISFTYLFAALILPPTSLLASALVGLLMLRRRPQLGAAITAASVAGLLVLSTPAVAFALMRTLEAPPLQAADRDRAQAIVILAGGRHFSAPEWDRVTVNDFTLRRLRYGARLARDTGLPVLITGGNPDRTGRTEADYMLAVLRDEFGVTPRWVERDSRTTHENATLSAPLLRADGIERVLLVTSSFHFRRALPQFEAAGISVIPAPTDFQGRRPFTAAQLVPSAEGLRVSYWALREWLANLLYAINHTPAS